mmetsp:Transcript_17607/g.30211  ORF Transcript_17607/g.30211 Transcript_17607/m.30211 type:complete len:94 (+) Transcript_17607:127-408(+)
MEKLGSITCEKLLSHLQVQSVAQAAAELVANSLDAGATTISLSLKGSSDFLCTDNGHGMSQTQLALVGRYASSKEALGCTLGYRLRQQTRVHV